jgi:LysM repeat protein
MHGRDRRPQAVILPLRRRRSGVAYAANPAPPAARRSLATTMRGYLGGTMAAQPGQHEPHQQHTMLLWWLVPVGLVVALLLVGVVTVASLSGSGGSPESAGASAPRNLPPYWIVKPGDTYSRIAQRTGLSMDQLETFNPLTDPTTIAPGQRIKLRLHVPKPPPKPLGPRFWTVRQGQSFGSIAAKTGHRIATLQHLNPKLKPEALQIGDRVRLRR